MINGITFPEQLMTSANFAHFMNTFLNHSNGITKGCEISFSGINVFVQKGYFIAFGRMVQIVGTEEIPFPEVLSGKLYCKVIFEIDLSKENTTDEFNQGRFVTLTSTSAYPAVRQEDLDNDGTVYQMPWCQYIKSVDRINDFRDLREILKMEELWASVSKQNQNYKEEFDRFFGEQKEDVEKLISDLKGKGYLTMEQARQQKNITLARTGWSTTAPYSQTVVVEGITDIDTPIPMLDLSASANYREDKLLQKQFGWLSYYDSGMGKITFVCKHMKPTMNLPVVLKGV